MTSRLFRAIPSIRLSQSRGAFSTTARSSTQYHHLLGVPVNEVNPFRVDPGELKRAYLKAQRLAHPDAHAGTDNDTAAAISAQLNEAYTTLIDPAKRGEYLLSLEGKSIGEHEKLDEDVEGGQEVLLTAMEAQMALNEAESIEEVEALEEENTVRYNEDISNLDDAFAKKDYDAAMNASIRLKYWTRIRKAIRAARERLDEEGVN